MVREEIVMPIKRHFSDERFQRIESDFGFLPGILKGFYGEIEFAIRDNYFNLYYRGNSVAKVSFENSDGYLVSIHEKFFPKSISSDARFSPSSQEKYVNVKVDSKHLHAFFQKKYLDDILAKIKEYGYSEELAFEQMLITDNLDREDIIIIDRQITDKELYPKRMDILALRHVGEGNYSFLVIEVKMGNNPDLMGDVAKQINGYLEHIRHYKNDYKLCYEKHYQQKRRLGIITIPESLSISIVPEVDGLIVVGGYSGIARERIKKLQNDYPKLQLKQFRHRLYDYFLI